MASTGSAEIETLLANHGELYLVLLDRTDSAWWREQTEANAAYVEALDAPRELLIHAAPTATDDLRIWKLTRARRASDTSTTRPGES